MQLLRVLALLALFQILGPWTHSQQDGQVNPWEVSHAPDFGPGHMHKGGCVTLLFYNLCALTLLYLLDWNWGIMSAAGIFCFWESGGLHHPMDWESGPFFASQLWKKDKDNKCNKGTMAAVPRWLSCPLGCWGIIEPSWRKIQSRMKQRQENKVEMGFFFTLVPLSSSCAFQCCVLQQ